MFLHAFFFLGSGSLSLWNFGGRIRIREFHYPLHTVSAQEKDIICESLWKQHTKEMLLIESNLLTINHQKVTLEFQPSADQAWQCWANNVLPASATYPSPYANVHKGNLTHIGGTVGDANCTWKAPTMDDRKNELNKLNRFRKTLSNDLTPKQKHDEELGFMAEHGIRQLGEPRIGSFADRQRPDPLHLEINSWQHILNVLYLESIRRDRYEHFDKVLRLPKTEGGCNLKFVADKIKEHYDAVSTRMKLLTIRLIGSQAITLAQFGYRLIDCLETETISYKYEQFLVFFTHNGGKLRRSRRMESLKQTSRDSKMT